jgi:hypothetical protein
MRNFWVQCEHNALVTLQNCDLLTKAEILKLKSPTRRFILFWQLVYTQYVSNHQQHSWQDWVTFSPFWVCPGLLMVKVGQGEQQCYCVNLWYSQNVDHPQDNLAKLGCKWDILSYFWPPTSIPSGKQSGGFSFTFC